MYMKFCLHVCSVWQARARCPPKSEVGITYPRAGVSGGWELLCGCQELTSGVQEQQVALTSDPALLSL